MDEMNTEEKVDLQTNTPPAVEAPLFNPIQISGGEGEDALLVQKRLLDELMKDAQNRINWRKPLETVWRKIYQFYMAKSDDTRLATRSKVVLPKVFQAIEAGVPKLLSILFGRSPFFEVVSKFPKRPIDPDVCRNIESLLLHQLDLTDFFSKFVEFAKQLLMYGTSYFTITWRVKREWVTERTPAQAPTLFGIQLPFAGKPFESKRVLKVTERRPEIKVLPIWSVFPSPDQNDPQEGNGVFWLDTISHEDLKELSSGRLPIYGNFEEVQRTVGNTRSSASTGMALSTTIPSQFASIRTLNDPYLASSGASNDVSLLHFWGKKDLDGDGFKEEVHIVIANRSVIIRAVPNPYEHGKRPLVRGQMFPVPGEWFGMGIVEPALATLEEINTLHNQYVDMNSLIINRMWQADPTLDVDVNTLVSSPGQIVLSTPLDAVKALPQDPLPFSPVQMLQELENELDSTMVPKSVQGTQESGALGRTKGGAQLIISQALERFGGAATLIERMVLHEVLLQMHQLNGQYLDEHQYLQDVYKNIWPVPPTPEQLREELSFKFLGVNDTVNKEAAINQITAFVNTWAKVLGLNFEAVAKEHWKLMDLKLPADIAIQQGPMPQQVVMQGGGSQDPMAAQIAQNGVGGGVAVPPIK